MVMKARCSGLVCRALPWTSPPEHHRTNLDIEKQRETLYIPNIKLAPKRSGIHDLQPFAFASTDLGKGLGAGIAGSPSVESASAMHERRFSGYASRITRKRA